MAARGPLQERVSNIVQAPAQAAALKQADGLLSSHPVKPTSHLTVRTDRDFNVKRSRDSHHHTRAGPHIGNSSIAKKSRGDGSQNKAKKKPSVSLPPGRPHLTRRTDGIAPNGNPQCWYAPHESEMDPHRIAQRMKQVEFGKNSAGYKAYTAAVPRDQRRGDDPQTPDVRTKCSKRCFDGLLRSWRRRLHRFDPPDDSANAGADGPLNVSAAVPAMPQNIPSAATGGVRGRSRSEGGKEDGPADNTQNDLHNDGPATPTSMEPVPWEEIERMSLCSPLWCDDKDSDISEPDSQDRVTIYTNELSPTPSELICSQHDQRDAPAGTPNSPFSPWAPWGNAKASFADALRSPVGLLDLDGPPPTSAVPLSSKISSTVSAQAADTTAPTDVRPTAWSSGSQGADVDQDMCAEASPAPATFGAAFASGFLKNSETGQQDVGSLFGSGLRGVRVDPPKLEPPTLGAAGPAVSQDMTAAEDLEGGCHSLSMRAMPAKDGAAWGRSDNGSQ